MFLVANTANPRPIIGSGVDAAIHAKAGEKLLEARKQIVTIAPGSSAITKAFGLEAKYVNRNAVSLGGDCDTLTCIAGSVAEGFYGVPEDLKKECRKRLDKKMLAVLDRIEDFNKREILENHSISDFETDRNEIPFDKFVESRYN